MNFLQTLWEESVYNKRVLLFIHHKITILFTFLIHLRNIYMLSSVSSFLFIKLCELYRHKKP
ncbi:hypothetical protein FNE59_12945 [Bacillus thuringiensis]|uniref:Uncharacterized protein n=1 Tax=Bacillus thuringiensis TaxID=1428 RepID=A0AAP4Q7H2_BACTU|nr:hypothetical protein [Bacillus thuringiensis]MDN7079136.1 hypothetical protein [Bacillus thuringiensis]MDQ7257335.1 hypothetical protein [Bacillus thuringiensis]MDR5028105.1 hypothetical protein [Bacillus thuringiensis]MDR5046482.1 hypothetical protein [Bacillus thuringiensis]